MVPRLKASLGLHEAMALLPTWDAVDASVARFEREFSAMFGGGEGISFSYGRTALWAFFRSVGLEHAEVIVPAYTCVVVAHAVVLSGNVPRFVDVREPDYNMDLDALERAITPETGAVIATHLFGYPLDCDRLEDIVSNAEARFGRKIWIVHDCAHAFGAHWRGELVCQRRDVALFGLGISKLITSIFGGLILTRDGRNAARLRAWREANCQPGGTVKGWQRRAYLAGIGVAFSALAYPGVRWLETHTPLLDSYTKAYHLDEEIHFPPDYREGLTAAEARVGRAQLARYGRIVQARLAHASFYDRALHGAPGVTRPPMAEGATYSHYTVRVESAARVCARAERRHVQLGRVLDYAIPARPDYRRFAGSQEFPRARAFAATTVNLPVHADLTTEQRDLVVPTLLQAVNP